MEDYIDIVFDDGPGPNGGRFVEVEDAQGASIKAGTWNKRKTGYWALRIPMPSRSPAVRIASALEDIALSLGDSKLLGL